jgi:hypothetical protein
MSKPSKRTKNPLTIIAIFAAIVEASALASLPFLKEQSQDIYTWFLVGFPPFLTLLFFITLNFNYKVLYSPSDYTNETDFLTIYDKTHAQTEQPQPPAPAINVPPENTTRAPPIQAETRTDNMHQPSLQEPAPPINRHLSLSFTSREVYILDCQHFSSDELFTLAVQKILNLPAATHAPEVPQRRQLIVLIAEGSLESRVRKMLMDMVDTHVTATVDYTIAAYNLKNLSLTSLTKKII